MSRLQELFECSGYDRLTRHSDSRLVESVAAVSSEQPIGFTEVCIERACDSALASEFWGSLESPVSRATDTGSDEFQEYMFGDDRVWFDDAYLSWACDGNARRAPSVLFRLSGRGVSACQLSIGDEVVECAARAHRALLSEELAAEVTNEAKSAVARVGPFAQLRHFGFKRGLAGAIRLVLNVETRRLVEVIRSLGWPGDVASIGPMVARLCRLSRNVGLQVSCGIGVSSRIGVEIATSGVGGRSWVRSCLGSHASRGVSDDVWELVGRWHDDSYVRRYLVLKLTLSPEMEEPGKLYFGSRFREHRVLGTRSGS